MTRLTNVCHCFRTPGDKSPPGSCTSLRKQTQRTQTFTSLTSTNTRPTQCLLPRSRTDIFGQDGHTGRALHSKEEDQTHGPTG